MVEVKQYPNMSLFYFKGYLLCILTSKEMLGHALPWSIIMNIQIERMNDRLIHYTMAPHLRLWNFRDLHPLLLGPVSLGQVSLGIKIVHDVIARLKIGKKISSNFYQLNQRLLFLYLSDMIKQAMMALQEMAVLNGFNVASWC